MILTATIGGVSRSPLVDSSIALRRPVSSASLLIDDPDGDISISTLDSVLIERLDAITEDSGLPGAMLPGAWLPGGGTPTNYTGTPIFRGFVSALTIDPRGKASQGSRLLKIECVDLNWRLDNPPNYLTKSYSSQTDQAIILDAVSQLGLSSIITASSGTVSSIKSNLSVAFDGATMRDVLDEMTRVSGAVWWVNDQTLYYNTEAAATAAAWNIDTDSPNNSTTFNVQGLSMISRHDFPLNSVYVVGPIDNDGRKASATASDATSISTYGTFKRKIELKSIIVDSYAQAAADQLVAAGKDPRQTIKFEFDDADSPLFLTVNEKITATCARFGLSSQDFVTREVKIVQRAGGVSEFSVDAGDFRPTVTDTLKRLDAASKTTTHLPMGIRGLDFKRASSEYVETGTTIPNIDDLTDFTIFATIRPDALASSTSYTIVSKQTAASSGWKIWITSSSINITRARSISNFFYSRGHGMTVGGVYRVVIVASESLGARFWVNGSEKASGGTANLGSGTLGTETSEALRIARANPSVATDYFEGFIGSVALWNVALPETTAANLHNVNTSNLPFSGNAQLIWVMDEFEDSSPASGSGSIRDRSGNDYHGTPSNTPNGDTVVFLED